MESLINAPANMYNEYSNKMRDVMQALNHTTRRFGNKTEESSKEIQTVHDLMKHMKTVYKDYKHAERKHEPLEAKILSRRMEEFGFSTQPLVDEHAVWEEKYRRKQERLRAGNFSCNYKPYASLGDVTTDPVLLFLGCFNDCVREIPKFSYNLTGAYQKSVLPPKKVDNGSKEQEVICDIIEREKGCKDAGLRFMKQALSESTRQITDVAAGQSYVKHMQQCQLEKETQRKLSAKARQETSSRRMVLQSLGSDILHMPVISYVNISSRGRDCDAEKSMKKQAAERSKEGIVRYKQQRKLQAVTDKLRYIYIILCSLYNMRNRYLKNRQPLSAQIVKSLRRDPFVLRKEREAQQSRGHTMRSCSIVSVGSKTDASQTKNSSVGAASTTMSNLPVIQSQYQRRASGVSSMFRNTQAKSLLISHASESGRRKTRSRLLSMVGSGDGNTKVETWEDLLNLGTKTRLLKYLRSKTMPLWQQHWSSDDQPTAKKEQDDEHMEDYHAEEAVGRMRAGWLRVKEKSQKSMQQSIEKVDRERMVKFRYKMSTMIYPHPLFEIQREIIREASREAARDPVLITDDIIPWYESLIHECTGLGVRHDVKVVECLRDIEKFLLEDLAHLPYAKFVLTEILDGKASMLKEWLNHRKLHVIE